MNVPLLLWHAAGWVATWCLYTNGVDRPTSPEMSDSFVGMSVIVFGLALVQNTHVAHHAETLLTCYAGAFFFAICVVRLPGYSVPLGDFHLDLPLTTAVGLLGTLTVTIFARRELIPRETREFIRKVAPLQHAATHPLSICTLCASVASFVSLIAVGIAIWYRQVSVPRLPGDSLVISSSWIDVPLVVSCLRHFVSGTKCVSNSLPAG